MKEVSIVKSKQLIINLFSNIIAFSSSLIISFVLTPFLIESLGKEAYSFFPMSNNFIGYLTILTLALNSMISRYITIEIERDNILKARTYYSSTFFANLALIILLIIPSSIFIYYLDKILNIPIDLVADVKNLFGLVLVSLFVNLLATVFGVATFATNRMDLRALGEIFRGIFRLALFAFFFGLFEPSLIYIGVIAVIIAIYNLFIQMFFTKKLLPQFKVLKKHFEIKAVKELTFSGGWNVINSLGMSLLLGMSLFLVNYFSGAEAGGDFSIALMLPAFISGVISMIVSVLLPQLTKVFALGDKKAFKKELLFSQKILSLLTTIPVALLIVFGNDFFKLWVPTEYSSILPKLSFILLLPLIIHGNMWSIYSANIVLNKVRIPSLILLVSGCLALLLSVLLTPYYNGNIYIVPLITTTVSILYYFVFIPCYTAKCLESNPIHLYNNIIKSLLMVSFFIFMVTLIRPYIVILVWWDFFFWCAIFGFVGFTIHILFILNKNDRKFVYLMIKSLKNKLKNRVENVSK